MRNAIRPTPPVHLDGPGSAGRVENGLTVAFFSDSANATRPFRNYRAYKHESVSSLLAEVFHGKCAYCESRFDHVAPADIEHYRPKAAISLPGGALLKPGYYWLAASWQNLLLSCIDCNRERTHIFSDGRRIKSGKGNRFPLANDASRATSPGDEALEEPLLLNPCDDNVEALLSFTPEGAIQPAFASGREHQRAVVTIDILGLQRPRLAARREERMLFARASVEKYIELRDEFEIRPGDRFIQSFLVREMQDLKKLMSDTTEFSSMIHSYIRQACPELFV